MAIAKSVLTELVKKLPNKSILTAGLENKLKKGGVKPDELRFSGITDAVEDTPELRRAGLEPPKQFTKQDITDTIEANPIDARNTDVTGLGNEDYSGLLLPESNVNSYKMNVREMGQGKNVYSHAQGIAPNYVFHSRTTEETVDGIDTIMVQEIQSDVHQSIRRRGPTGPEGPRPPSPLANNWSTKAIEQELLNAVESGKGAISVPLELNSIANESLARSAGVQKWYNTSVRSILKKTAKRIGGEYKETETLTESLDVPYDEIKVSRALIDDPTLVTDVAKAFHKLHFPNSPNPAPKYTRYEVTNMLTGSNTFELPEDIIKRFYDNVKAGDKKSLLEYANKPNSIETLKNGLRNSGLQFTTELRKAIEIGEPKAVATELAKLDKDSLRYLGVNLAPDVDPVILGSIVLPKLPKSAGLPEWAKKFELFSLGGAAAVMTPTEQAEAKELGIGKGISAGFNVQEITDMLEEKQGLSKDQARKEIDEVLKQRIPDLLARDPSVTPEEVQELIGITEDEYNGLFNEEELAKLKEIDEQGINYNLTPIVEEGSLTSEVSTKSIERLEAETDQVYGSYIKDYQQIRSGVFSNNEAQANFDNLNKNYAVSMANALRSAGKNVIIDNDTMELLELSEDGTTTPLSTEFFESMAASEFELLGTSLGGYYFWKFGLNIGSKLGIQGKLATGAIALATSALGVGGGGAIGAGLDTYRNSFSIKENLDASVYKKKMMDAGVGNATLEIAFGGVIGTALAGAKGVILLGRAFNKFSTGNRAGAFKELKEFMGLDDTQVDAIIKEWETITGAKAGGMLTSRAEKALKIVPLTQPGGESVVRSAARRSPIVSSSIARSINARAKDINRASESLTNENIGTVVKDDLDTYVKSVKDFYTGAKNHAISATEDSSYMFNYDKLAIDPILEEMKKVIRNPVVLEKFEFFSNRLKDLGGKLSKAKIDESPIYIPDSVKIDIIAKDSPKLRSFSDLLDLRRTLNDFKYNTQIRSVVDYKSVNRIIANVDNEISRAAKAEMDDGEAWLKMWKRANVEYGNMKVVEKNVLFKALTRPGVSPSAVVKLLANRISSIDGTFMSVLNKLPPKTRDLAEGAVLDELVKKNTKGFVEGMQATNFSMLNEKLQKLTFTSKSARQLKRGVKEIARVFKNDLELSKASGLLSTPQMATALTDNLVIKTKWLLMTKIFNHMRSLAPGEDANVAALINHTAKVLKNPTNAKSVNDLIKALPDDPELEASIKQLAIEFTKFGEPEKFPLVSVFRKGTPGSSHTAKDGKYGKGFYWRTTKPSGSNILEDTALPGRIATESDVQKLLGDTPFEADLIKEKGLLDKLKQQGYTGFAADDTVFVFSD